MNLAAQILETGRLYLTGFMGAGKTTTGRELAVRAGWSFCDLDDEIECRTGRTIFEIFEEGEETFRVLEREALERTSEYSRRVIALGGGAFVWRDNREYLADKGVVVYLDVAAEVLFERVRHSNSVRPLLSGFQGTDLLDHIKTVLEMRHLFYERADLIIDCFPAKTASDIVEEIYGHFQ